MEVRAPQRPRPPRLASRGSRRHRHSVRASEARRRAGWPRPAVAAAQTAGHPTRLVEGTPLRARRRGRGWKSGGRVAVGFPLFPPHHRGASHHAVVPPQHPPPAPPDVQGSNAAAPRGRYNAGHGRVRGGGWGGGGRRQRDGGGPDCDHGRTTSFAATTPPSPTRSSCLAWGGGTCDVGANTPLASVIRRPSPCSTGAKSQLIRIWSGAAIRGQELVPRHAPHYTVFQRRCTWKCTSQILPIRNTVVNILTRVHCKSSFRQQAWTCHANPAPLVRDLTTSSFSKWLRALPQKRKRRFGYRSKGQGATCRPRRPSGGIWSRPPRQPTSPPAHTRRSQRDRPAPVFPAPHPPTPRASAASPSVSTPARPAPPRVFPWPCASRPRRDAVPLPSLSTHRSLGCHPPSPLLPPPCLQRTASRAAPARAVPCVASRRSPPLPPLTQPLPTLAALPR